MSGVWVFNNGVIRLVENPNQSGGTATQTHGRRNVLVYLPTGEVVSSYSSLEQILRSLGWERYYNGDSDLIQYHKRSSIDLISLPRDFSKFNSVYISSSEAFGANLSRCLEPAIDNKDVNHFSKWRKPHLVCVCIVLTGEFQTEAYDIYRNLSWPCELPIGPREYVCSSLNSPNRVMRNGISSLR